MINEEAAKILKLERASWSANPKLKVDQRLYDAIDVAIKELEQTDKIEESNFGTKQYKADLQSAYECGYQHGYADAWNDECSSDDIRSCDNKDAIK